MLTLSEVQARRNLWVARNFPGDDMPNSLLGAVEELGELSHHYLKLQQGIRGTPDEHIEGILDAVADCVIYLCGVCTYLGVDFGQLVSDTWKQVEKRDWVADPEKGGQ